MDKNIITALTLLIEAVPPHQLRHTINRLYFSYIINNKDNLPPDITEVTEDLHFLNNFLEEVDKIVNKKRS